VIESLPGNTDAREEAGWIISRLVENDKFLSADACARNLLQRF